MIPIKDPKTPEIYTGEYHIAGLIAIITIVGLLLCIIAK